MTSTPTPSEEQPKPVHRCPNCGYQECPHCGKPIQPSGWYPWWQIYPYTITQNTSTTATFPFTYSVTYES